MLNIIQTLEIGVILTRVCRQTNLSFKDHIGKVISSCFLILRILRKIKFLLPEDSLKTVVTALILSRLDYCNSLYINLQKGQLARLQTVQNAAARLVTGTPRFASVRSGLRALHWLPVGQRIKFKVLCLVFKALNGMGPGFLRHMIQWYVPGRMLRSSQAKQVVTPRVNKLAWGGRSFHCCATRAWNGLPIHIRNSSDILSFRKALKTWLFI